MTTTSNIAVAAVFGFMVSKVTATNGIEKIRECYNALELPFNEEVIGRAHTVGKEYAGKISKKKVKSIIVKFKSWEARQQLYNTHSRVQNDG